MEPGSVYKLLLLILLFAGSAFFSATETALMKLSNIKIQQMSESDSKREQLVAKLLQDPNTLLSAILIGNNLVNIAASSLVTVLIIDEFGARYVGLGTIVITIIILVFGEITPKSLANSDPEKYSLKSVKLINLLTIVLKPIIVVLNFVTKRFIKLLGGDDVTIQPLVTQEELMTVLSAGHEEGLLEGEEKDMIYNVFEFSDTSIREVMIPRTEMIAIDVNATIDEFQEIYKKALFSRIPVYDESIDDIIGILYVKDLLFLDPDDFQIKDHLRQPTFTYDFISTKEMFQEMRAEKNHLVIVLDEYGGTAGLVTIEDLIEEIVGEIEDEYDTVPEIITNKEDVYFVTGSVKIEDINEYADLNIESDSFDSIGGLIIGTFGGLPEEGDELKYDGLKFTVKSIDKNKIEDIMIEKLEE